MSIKDTEIDNSISDYHRRTMGIYVRPPVEPVETVLEETTTEAEAVAVNTFEPAADVIDDEPLRVLSNPVFAADFKALLNRVEVFTPDAPTESRISQMFKAQQAKVVEPVTAAAEVYESPVASIEDQSQAIVQPVEIINSPVVETIQASEIWVAAAEVAEGIDVIHKENNMNTPQVTNDIAPATDSTNAPVVEEKATNPNDTGVVFIGGGVAMERLYSEAIGEPDKVVSAGAEVERDKETETTATTDENSNVGLEQSLTRQDDGNEWRNTPVVNVQRVQKHKKQQSPVDTNRLLDYNEERSKRIQKTPKAFVPTPRKAALLQSTAGAALVDKFLANRVQNDAEGESHVNLDLDSMFEWARALTLNAHTPFEHPQLGRFNSIGGLWNYLVYDADDNYRSLSGSQVGNYRNAQMHTRENQIEGFLTVMADAVWLKVQTYPAMCKMLVENELPFRMYRAEGQSGLRVNNKLVNWYPGVIEEISRALKSLAAGEEGAMPDFSHLTTLNPRVDNRRQNKPYRSDRNQGYRN